MLACGPGDRCHHINDEPALVLQNGEGMEEWWCKWSGGVNRMQKRSDMSIASIHCNNFWSLSLGHSFCMLLASALFRE